MCKIPKMYKNVKIYMYIILQNLDTVMVIELIFPLGKKYFKIRKSLRLQHEDF